MTQEEKRTLATLLQKAADENAIHIYDSNDNIYNVDWVYEETQGDVMLKIKLF